MNTRDDQVETLLAIYNLSPTPQALRDVLVLAFEHGKTEGYRYNAQSMERALARVLA